MEHIIFRNEENGYTVCVVNWEGEEVTCVGVFSYISEGELIEAQGSYTEHATYGKQFKVEAYQIKIPQDTAALERYLGSGAIKGIGAALAVWRKSRESAAARRRRSAFSLLKSPRCAMP